MDIQILNQGTLIGFRPMSEAGRAFLEEKVSAPDYMMLGSTGTVWADHRMAQPIIDGMEADGLVLE